MDGKTATAYLRTSQSTELRFFPSGSVVINTCGGRLVSAPSSTKDSRVLFEIISSIGPRTCRYSSYARLLSNGLGVSRPGTQNSNRLGHVFRTDREFFPFRPILRDDPDVALLV